MMHGARARKYLIIECQQTVMAEILIKHLTIQVPASHCAQRSATSHPDQKTDHASGDRSNAGNNGACRCAEWPPPHQQRRLR